AAGTSSRPAREVGTMPLQAARVKRACACSLARPADGPANADVCLTLEHGGEARARRGRIDRTHEHGKGMRRDRRELRAAIREHDAQVEEERRRAHGGIDREMPDVVPCGERKAPCESRIEQTVEGGGSENEEAKHTAEDRQVEVSASRQRTAVVVAEPPLRLPP